MLGGTRRREGKRHVERTTVRKHGEGDMDPRKTCLTKWHWIVELARKKPGTVLFLAETMSSTSNGCEKSLHTKPARDGANGPSTGVTAQDYEAKTSRPNLRALLGAHQIRKLRSAAGAAETYIPKADGSQRADRHSGRSKIRFAQRAGSRWVPGGPSMRQELFCHAHTGFRPGRSAHSGAEPTGGRP